MRSEAEKARRRKKSEEFRKANPDYGKSWYQKNKARVATKQKARYEAGLKKTDKAVVAAWREKNKEAISAKNKAWRDAHPHYGRTHWLKSNYGLSIEEYDAMHKAQSGLCAICFKTSPDGKRLSVDHDHRTGAIRSLLCSPCNVALGNFNDDPLSMRMAADYIERHRKFPKTQKLATKATWRF